MSELLNFYLFLYNLLQSLGWAVSMVKILSNAISNKSVTGAYASAGELICMLQTLSLLETIHGAIGIVPNGVLMPLMQWIGRTHVVVVVAHGITEVQEHSSIFYMFLAWCSIEVIRYPNYALNCYDITPYFLTYLRYTAFIGLYPIGLVSEMTLMYFALPFIKKKDLYAKFFAGLPFSYLHFVLVLLYLYPFLFLKLYQHMFRQRGSKLGKYQKHKIN